MSGCSLPAGAHVLSTRPTQAACLWLRLVRVAVVVTLVVLMVMALPSRAADFSQRFVAVGSDGRLIYELGPRGDRMPDYSHAGFGGGGVPLPTVPARVVVAPVAGDATELIQRAVDHVATLKPDSTGMRGAVQLESGEFRVAGQLRITATGVVLRGSGSAAATGTTIVATGRDRRALIVVRGEDPPQAPPPRQAIADAYVPCGSDRLALSPDHGLAAGDHVLVEHPSTLEWIAALGMNRFPSRGGGSWLDWRPGTLDLAWERVVTAVDPGAIVLDAPLPMALDAAVAAAMVRRLDWPGRIDLVGIESLRLVSHAEREESTDEDHAWDAVSLANVRDAWVCDCGMEGFAGSAVIVHRSASRVTVSDCRSSQPRSEIGGWRRRTFLIEGGQCLVRDCTAADGRQDFSVGHLAPGPNVFLRCRAIAAHAASGPLGSWATGVLYDTVEIDGGGLQLTNREIADHGTGWAAVNSTAWLCTAPLIECRMPPTAANWAVGPRGEYVGDGHWKQLDQSVKPTSLYDAQLRDRLRSTTPQPAAEPEAVHQTILDAADLPSRSAGAPMAPGTQPLRLENGWLTVDGRVVTGGRLVPPWWRGHTLPAVAAGFEPSITRFVPGHEQFPFTTDLTALASQLAASDRKVIEHHWGLWYDRRRDDHQTVRRITPDVWAPFDEQPWARSGQGMAWDGLSKYDLSRFNPWYFDRLATCASECERYGLVLIAHMYFQHNILESAAHWMDFPWRPANCLQATGFQEPPAFVPGGRIDVAEPFYDVTHPVRRDLHRAYIRHCLDTLSASPNVIVTVGEEYTGPEHFVRFWLETIRDWRRETGRRILVALSCTRDVQDAILSDPPLAAEVDVIDAKYWWYAADGTAYAPAGGERLAPRQQLRAWKGPKDRSFEQTARQIRELRLAWPEKAVICSTAGSDPAAVLLGGGSLAAVGPLAADMAEAAARLLPTADPDGSRPRLVGADGRVITASDLSRP